MNDDITVYNEKLRTCRREPARKSLSSQYRDDQQRRAERASRSGRKARINEVRERELMYG